MTPSIPIQDGSRCAIGVDGFDGVDGATWEGWWKVEEGGG